MVRSIMCRACILLSLFSVAAMPTSAASVPSDLNLPRPSMTLRGNAAPPTSGLKACESAPNFSVKPKKFAIQKSPTADKLSHTLDMSDLPAEDPIPLPPMEGVKSSTCPPPTVMDERIPSHDEQSAAAPNHRPAQDAFMPPPDVDSMEGCLPINILHPVEHMLSDLSEIFSRLLAGVPAVLDVDDVISQPLPKKEEQATTATKASFTTKVTRRLRKLAQYWTGTAGAGATESSGQEQKRCDIQAGGPLSLGGEARLPSVVTWQCSGHVAGQGEVTRPAQGWLRKVGHARVRLAAGEEEGRGREGGRRERAAQLRETAHVTEHVTEHVGFKAGSAAHMAQANLNLKQGPGAGRPGALPVAVELSKCVSWVSSPSVSPNSSWSGHAAQAVFD